MKVKKLKQLSLIFASLFILTSSIYFSKPSASYFQNKNQDQSISATLLDVVDDVSEADHFLDFQQASFVPVEFCQSKLHAPVTQCTASLISSIPFYLQINNLRI